MFDIYLVTRMNTLIIATNIGYKFTKSSGHYAPLLLAPAEGLGALWALLGAFGPLFITIKLYFEL